MEYITYHCKTIEYCLHDTNEDDLHKPQTYVKVEMGIWIDSESTSMKSDFCFWPVQNPVSPRLDRNFQFIFLGSKSSRI